MTSAALALDMPYDAPLPITVASDLLGPLSVSPDAVITFPNGLLGFPECRAFVVMPSEREHLYWIQSVEYSTLVLLAIDPFVFFPGYTVDLATTDLGRVVTSPNDVMVLSIVTLPSSREASPTANLQGPVVVNTATHQGYQVVLPDGQHGIRERFTL